MPQLIARVLEGVAVGPCEQALADIGIEVEEQDFAGMDQGLTSCLVVRPVGDLGNQWRCVVRVGVDSDVRERAACWFRDLMSRFPHPGLEVDGWQATSWGGYQLYGREHFFEEW